MSEAAPTAAVLAPTPHLTVTVEGRSGHDDIHLHAGGQAVWVARMLVELGVRSQLCGPVGGETGRVLRTLVGEDGLEWRAVASEGRNAAYLHDRRSGERRILAEMPADGLDRHVFDDVYGTFLSAALGADVAVLVGAEGATAEAVFPAESHEPLARDLAEVECRTVADLSGAALLAAAAGGVEIVKVSAEDLQRDGMVEGVEVGTVVAAARRLQEMGAGTVVVSRGQDPAVVATPDGVLELRVPTMTTVDHRGAGDSMTAGIAAAIAYGLPMLVALQWGAAAGALNVTRHGLGTGSREAIRRLVEHVEIVPLEVSA